jgi:hypothetical protein
MLLFAHLIIIEVEHHFGVDGLKNPRLHHFNSNPFGTPPCFTGSFVLSFIKLLAYTLVRKMNFFIKVYVTLLDYLKFLRSPS